MSETPPESPNLPKPSPVKNVSADDCIAGEAELEAVPAEPTRLHPDDLAALREGLEPGPNLGERVKVLEMIMELLKIGIMIVKGLLIFVVLAAVIWLVAAVVIRDTSIPILVIEPFEVPESLASEHGLTGRAVAQMLRGEMTRISTQSPTSIGSPRIVAEWETRSLDISVPGTGRTLDGMLRHLQGNETRVYGALLVEGSRGGPQSLRLHVHVTGRPDMLGEPVAQADLKRAVKKAAIYVFRNTYDHVYASYLMNINTTRAEDENREILEGRYVGDRISALSNLVIIYSELGVDEETIELYQMAASLDPVSSGAYDNLGIIYSKLGRDERAIALYQRAIVLDPDSPSTHSNLGSSYYRLGRYERAIALYQRAIVLDPDSSVVHDNLGLAYKKLGQHEDAKAAFETAAALRATGE